MGIEGLILPNVPPMSWKKFKKDYHPFSIGLDGFIAAGPKFQSKSQGGPRANFNHHECVDRDSTLATCMQVSNAIRTGLIKEFSDAGQPIITWYTNDCDEDICMSTWLLQNLERAKPIQNLLLNKLVNLTNLQDMHSGLWPLPQESKVLRTLAWIYNPYRQARLSGVVDSRDPDRFWQVILDVHNRIDKYLANEGGDISLNLEFKTMGGGDGWKMIEEVGEHARNGFLEAGINAFVSVRYRNDGKYSYSFCRLSKFIPFPVPFILQRLNEIEDLTDSPHQYGGGTNTGGSPRVTGTKISPPEMIDHVNHILKEWNSTLSKTV